MNYKKLRASFDLKSFNDDEGTFEGYLSTFGNTDSQKDQVVQGAFKKTINDAEQKSRSDNNPVLFPILYQHNPDEPIGGFTSMREDSKGLLVNGFLDLDTEAGRRAYSGLKKGYLRSMSIGYRTIKDEMKAGTNIRLLKEIQLYEGSIVTFPANDQATVDTVKSENTLECAHCKELEAKLAALTLELETKAGRAISASNHAKLTEHTDNAMSGVNAAMSALSELKKSLDVISLSDAGDVSDAPTTSKSNESLNTNTHDTDLDTLKSISSNMKDIFYQSILTDIRKQIGRQ